MATWIRWSVCALALAFVSSAAGAQATTPWQEEWRTRWDRERAEVGALPLRLVPALSQVAQRQAEEMAGRGLRAPAAAAVSEWLRQEGYSAYDWRESFLLWPATASPVQLAARRESSRAALDGNYRDLGIGAAAVSHGGMLYVFLFGQHQGDFFAAATAGLADPARIAAEMLAGVNDVRRRAGLPPLAANPRLDRLAQQHAEDMLRRSYYGHRTPEGLGPSERARAAGYPGGVGENIVEQRFSVEEALQAWLDSPGHRRNILDPGCRELGFGLAVGAGYDAAPGGYRVIWVQNFGRGEGRGASPAVD